jgi:ribulose-phosphate 3-epimerase
MCADNARLGEEVRRLEEIGADMLHFDVMDGRFVPNLPLGLRAIEDLRKLTALPFDVHLMVEDNDFFVRAVLPLGVQRIAVHVESARHLDRTLASIRDGGARAGAALNPQTPPDALAYVLDRLDFVLAMTVNPGYAGQTLAPSAMQKIADCRAFLDRRGKALPIEVDGNVSFENVPEMVAAGAGVLVAGTSSLYHRGASLADNARRLRQAIARGLERRGSSAPAAPRAAKRT